MRSSIASILGRHLANLRDKSFESLPEDLQKRLNTYGIDVKDWDLIRSNRDAMKLHKGRMYVTTDMTHMFTKESISDYLDKKNPTDRDIEKAKQDIQFKLQMYFNEETDLGQLTPGAWDKAFMFRGIKKGTFAGEMLRFLWQYKAYTLNITRRGLGRLLLSNSNDGLMKSLLSGNLSTRGMMEYMLSSIAFGYISYASAKFLKDGYIANPMSADTMEESLLYGGGLGMFGDYIFHNYNKYGQGLIPTIAGPVAGAASDMTKLMSTMATFDNNGHRISYHDRVLKNILLMTKSYTPFGNLLGVKNGYHYLLNHYMIGNVDPSYVRNHDANVKKANEDNIPLF